MTRTPQRADRVISVLFRWTMAAVVMAIALGLAAYVWGATHGL